MDKLFFRTPYNYDRESASVASGLSCEGDPGVTQQSFKDECDINVIVERFGLTGELPENYKPPVSGDFTGIHDFKSAMDAIKAAEAKFMELPGELRARFGHDPDKLIEFCEDGKNLEEARKLGLVPMPPEKTRDVVQAVDELASKIVPPKVA